jgi:hypothetical protein
MIKLIDILREIESNKILIPRRFEGRKEKIINLANEKIQQYIKDGSKGDLNLSNTLITSLPSNLLKVGGDLNLKNTQITSLPDNLRVNGYLKIIRTPIILLPNNLKVNGDMDLIYCKIDSIPNNLQIENDLTIFDTPLNKKYTEEEIKQIIEDKGGYVNGYILYP